MSLTTLLEGSITVVLAPHAHSVTVGTVVDIAFPDGANWPALVLEASDVLEDGSRQVQVLLLTKGAVYGGP